MQSKIFTVAFILLLGLLFFALPNLFNFRERENFSDEKRIELAKRKYRLENLKDSISVRISDYYTDKSKLHLWAFGEKYRHIWASEIKIPVFSLNDSTQQYTCNDFAGSHQTIAIEIKDRQGRVWTLRSVDKDQSGALSPLWKASLARPVVRDQTAAMNPFAAFIVDDLAESAKILHTNPRMVFIPYMENLQDSCRNRMAGRVALLEEELDEQGWANSRKYFNVDTIVDTDDMFIQLKKHSDRTIDTVAYLKARLFDILIADWDRHEGNWAWALKNDKYIPIPIDRDMAFYLFDDGALSKPFLLLNNKFRSFHPQFKDISGFGVNSKALDQKILHRVPKKKFITTADTLQMLLTDNKIKKAIKEYPDAVYKELGKKHVQTLIARREQLNKVAREFYKIVHNE